MAYTKPRPNIDHDIKPFWDGLREHKFLLMRCKTCGEWYWPAAYCRHHEGKPFMQDMEWTEASGKGTVFVYNIHHVAFNPAFNDDIPYVLALIELDEGPMFGTNIIGCKPEDVSIGMRVEIVYEDWPEEDFTIPKMRPIS